MTKSEPVVRSSVLSAFIKAKDEDNSKQEVMKQKKEKKDKVFFMTASE